MSVPVALLALYIQVFNLCIHSFCISFIRKKVEKK